MKWMAIAISLLVMAPRCGDETGQRLRFGVSYGHINPSQLYNYDMVIVEPDHYTRSEVLQLKSTNTEVIAYISLGEVGTGRWYYPMLEQRGFLGRNENWNSPYLNLADSATRSILVDKVAGRIMDKSFDGLFLDTVDDVAPWTERDTLAPYMTRIIQKLHHRWPHARIIQNGGLFLLDETHSSISAILDEDVASQYNFKTRNYGLRPESSYREVVSTLDSLHKRYRLPVFIVEYANSQTLRDAVRDRLDDTDFPYFITTIELDTLPSQAPYGHNAEFEKQGAQ